MTLSAVALVLWGILALFTQSDFSPWIVIVLAIALGVLGLLLPRNRSLLVLLLSASLSLGGLSLWLQAELLKPSWLIEYSKTQATEQFTVEVLNRPKEIFRDFGNQANFGVAVRLMQISDEAASGRGFLIYKEAELRRGQVIQFEARVSEAAWNARDAFTLSPKSEIEIVSEPQIGIAFFNDLRADYVAKLTGITPDAKVLVSGLAIGEVDELSPDLEEKMRQVSLTHLVAVSGSNCAIVVGIVYLVAVRLGFGRYLRSAVSLIALLLYVALVGPDPSVLRAAVMSASVIIMLSLGRKTFALNALALAAIVLLIADPWLAGEFGFGLSVLATGGILLLAPAMAERLAKRMPKLLALALAVTLSAQLMCLPLLLQLQTGIASYSIFANLLAAPAVAPVTILGILGVLATAVSGELVGLLSYCASLPAFWIESVAKFFSSFPLVYFPWLTGAAAVVVSVIGVIALAAWLRSDIVGFRFIGAAAGLVILVASFALPAFGAIVPKTWPIKNWQIVACDVGQGDGLVIRSLSRVAVVDVGRDPKTIDQCLTRLGIKEIDLMVLTHFDFDHVGGLEGALRNRKVQNAIVSGFPDDRPATEKSIKLLADANLVVANPQLVGKLGDLSWRVLSPSQDASEAKDSNDASVVMVFQSAELEIVLLGDLGETGQQRIQEDLLAQLSITNSPIILKVSHHGSNDQSRQLHESLEPAVAIVSVGIENGYGHPGRVAIEILEQTAHSILRTDQLGSISLAIEDGKIAWVGG